VRQYQALACLLLTVIAANPPITPLLRLSDVSLTRRMIIVILV
jgi:hypothetical protein